MLLVNTNRIVPYWTLGDADSNAAIIDHFRVPKTVAFKMRPSAQPFL